MPALRRRVVIIMPALAIALAAIVAACGGSSKSSATPGAPPSTAAPAASATTAPPTPTGTLPPPSASAAAKLRDAGEYEQAAQLYGEISAQSKKVDEQQGARLQQAQLLIRSGRGADAQPVLQAYLANAGTGGDASLARYMLASSLDDGGDVPGAIADYERYIAADGVLSDFARLERAKLLARAGRGAEAEQAAEAVLAIPALSDFLPSFMLSMGRAFDQGRDDARALAWYARAAASDPASALARSGAIRKRDGDPSWAADYLRVVTAYPSSGGGADLLDALDAAAVPVPSYSRGFVEYRAGRNAAARTSLERAVLEGDHAAQATYYLGALDERAGDDAAAIVDYQKSYELDPASGLADSALWWRARLLEDDARYADAGAVYGTLAAGYPASDFAADAAFRRGLVQYKAKSFAAAASTWASLTASGEAEQRFRARLWQGRALQQAGDKTGAAVLQTLADDPQAAGDFYALRAEVLLGKNDRSDKSPKLYAKVDWNKIGAYIQQVTGVDVKARPPRADARWQLVDALAAVGLTSQSDTVARAYLRGDAYDPLLLYDDLLAASGSGRTSLTARTATTLISSLATDAPPPPDDLRRLSYPAAYADLAADASKLQKISPLLLLSLVRQESFYDPEAGSGAGALGLTQVVPATGQSIAERLGVSPFMPGDLFRPKVSLQFGAKYLSDQLAGFDGNIYQALAAYNGGPGASSAAIKTAGGDDDLFVEDLEFDETKLYVRLVMENYARYRQLYAGVDRPSLPD